MTTYADLVSTYLDDPSSDHLAQLREAVRRAPNFDPGLVPQAVAGPLIEAGDYTAAVDALRDAMPGALFSPAAHDSLASALAGAGRDEPARRERSLAQTALRSILSTGDGSAERPWSVLRISDEYDVLRSLQRTATQQELVEHDHRYLDRIVCDDGSTLHFDVTDVVRRG